MALCVGLVFLDTNILLNFLRVAAFVHQLCNREGLGAVHWLLVFFFFFFNLRTLLV
jgi:hypothetical protein